MSFQYLKKQAVLLFTKGEKNSFDVYDISFTYKDTDGDLVMIESAEDLTAALEEYTDVGKIKIFAHVEKKLPASPFRSTSFGSAFPGLAK